MSLVQIYGDYHLEIFKVRVDKLHETTSPRLSVATDSFENENF